MKVDSKRSQNIRWVSNQKWEYHVVTVRCNSCHGRGPSVGVWLPAFSQGDAAKIMNERAIQAWNRRASEND